MTPPREKHAKAAPSRYRVTVPAADKAVNEWMDMQDNPSVSVRMAIREYIERHGFDDPTCRVVEQQPRRGRPPGSTTSAPQGRSAQDAGREPSGYDDEGDDDIDLEAHEPEPEPERSPLMANRMAQGRPAPRREEVAPEVPSGEPVTDGGQMDMGDIFGAMR